MWRPDGPMHETAWWSSSQGAVVICLMLLIAGLLNWLLVRSREAAAGCPARGSWHGDDEAVALVRMRYARGELDRDGFDRIVQDLTGRSPAIAEHAEPPATPTTEPA